MNKIFSKAMSLTMVALLMTSMTWAQDNKKPLSPPETATGMAGGANVKIDYSSPGVKGRKIWGGLVPYDKVWRTGANKATIFTTDKAITIEGKELPAGTYSLYTIPGEKEWVFIFNSQTGQWGINEDGSTTENPAKDVLRVSVKPNQSSMFNERMKFVIHKNEILLEWEHLSVPLKVK